MPLSGLLNALRVHEQLVQARGQQRVWQITQKLFQEGSELHRMIVKQVDARTRSKTSVNDLLRGLAD